jgi:S-adenosylmethionine/arginine decarboxylase-like enzyme
MYAESKSAGKHLLFDAKNIKNTQLLNNFEETLHMLDMLCSKYKFPILGRSYHMFEPCGFTILFLLSDSHLSLHTFPERNFVAIDLYTCKEYADNSIYEEIHDTLCKEYDCDRNAPFIIDRLFCNRDNNTRQ